jgi:hypothetical protein
VVAADHAGALERPHRGAGTADGESRTALGQLDVGQPPVGLQMRRIARSERIHAQIMPPMPAVRARRKQTSARELRTTVAAWRLRCGTRGR